MARVTNVGASDGIRTRDGRNHNPGLYQLSYARHRGPRKLYRSAAAGAPDGAPGGTRTPDRRIRNPLLYPAELRAHGEICAAPECITGPFPLLALSSGDAGEPRATAGLVVRAPPPASPRSPAMRCRTPFRARPG